MNSFAKGLFQMLVGWMRGLTGLWDGDWTQLDSMAAWLSGHWLLPVILIILIGTAADLGIWLIRWRPDLSWRSRWKMMRSFSVGGFLHEIRFRQGYSQDNTQIMEAARPIVEKPVSVQETRIIPTGPVHPVDILEEREQLEADLGVTRSEHAMDSAPAEENALPERRRRSDRYRSGLRGTVAQVRRRLREEREEEFEPDILPPIMSKEEAFRAPVYPKGQQNRYTRPSGGEEA